MIPRGPSRFLLVLVLSVSVGVGVLYAVLGGERVTPRKGIRIPTITGRREGGRPDSPIPGLPVIRRSEGAEYSSYQTVTFPGVDGKPDESFEFLAAYLRLEKARPMDMTADDILCLIFPAPPTIEEARMLGDRPAAPSVSIRAGKAILTKGFAETTDTPGLTSVWELTLSEDVVVQSTADGQEATLTADELVVRPEESRIVAEKHFKLVSGDLTVEGVGLEGDAGLGTFTVAGEIVVTMPTATIFPEIAEGGTTTRITCGGPLVVQRLGDGQETAGEWIPTRVEFVNSVRVVQQGPQGTDRILCDRLRVELLVRKPPETVPDEAPDAPRPEAVKVREIVASGTVDLIGARGSRASARELHVRPGEEETWIRLTGSISFSHRGPLEAGGPEGFLEVRSGGNAAIRMGATDGSLSATFTDGVSARRLDEKKNPVLTLDADRLEFSSGADGSEMKASGGARFGTSGLTGRADRIVWKQVDEENSEVRLIGSPEIIAEAGANLDPFAAATEAPAAKPGEPDTIVFLEAGESIVLEQKAAVSVFRMTRTAMIRRISDGVEKTRVTADTIVVQTESVPTVEDPAKSEVVIREVTARGNVVATGRPILTKEAKDEEDGKGDAVPGQTSMNIRATGDLFRYDTGTGSAVLSGGPAIVLIREEDPSLEKEKSWNRIAARRLIFGANLEETRLGTMVAEEEVSATVFLAVQQGDEPRPFTLTADRLELEPAPPPKEGEPAAPATPEGQIRSLKATGNVTLEAADWVVSGDSITFAGGDDRDIHVLGTPERPARMERTQLLAERTYHDLFRAETMQVRLKGQRLLRFESPTGGDLVLHRIADGEGAIGMPGATDPKKTSKGRVERVVAHGKGAILYDAEKLYLRIDVETQFEQFLDTPNGFKSVAKFRTDLMQAWLEKDADGVDILRRAEGRGNVKGEGDGWSLVCDSFEVDLKHHKTTILGSPALVTVNKAKNTVERAEYDYVQDEWEFFRVGQGPR